MRVFREGRERTAQREPRRVAGLLACACVARADEREGPLRPSRDDV